MIKNGYDIFWPLSDFIARNRIFNLVFVTATSIFFGQKSVFLHELKRGKFSTKKSRSSQQKY